MQRLLPKLPYAADLPDPYPEFKALMKGAGVSKLMVSRLPKIGANDALIVVDMQNDFVAKSTINPHGGNFMVPGAHQAAVKIVSLMDHFGQAGGLVVATRDYHPHDHCSFDGQGGTNPPHCIQGHVGSYFYEPIARALARLISASKTEKKRSPKIVFKGFHEDVDSFSALTYTEDNFTERKERKNVIGKMFCRPVTDGGREVSLSKDVMGCGRCTLRGAWTGSFVLKTSSMAAYSSEAAPLETIGSTIDVNAPPDVLAVLHGRQKLEDVLKAEGVRRIFVVGVAGDICVLDTALNADKDLEVFYVMDAARSVFIPMLGHYGSGYCSDPAVMVKKLAREGVSVVNSSDILRDPSAKRQMSIMAKVLGGFAMHAKEGGGTSMEVRPVNLLDLAVHVDTSKREAHMGLATHPYLRIMCKLGFGEVTSTSPPCAVLRPKPGNTSAAFYTAHTEDESQMVFVYPLPGVARVLGDVTSARRTTLGTLAMLNTALQFAIFGGFVILNRKGKVLRAVVTCASSIMAKDTDKLLVLGPAKHWDKSLVIDQARFHPTTFASLRSQGCTRFCWLVPGEEFKQKKSGDTINAGADWRVPPRGAFLYAFDDGRMSVHVVLE